MSATPTQILTWLRLEVNSTLSLYKGVGRLDIIAEDSDILAKSLLEQNYNLDEALSLFPSCS